MSLMTACVTPPPPGAEEDEWDDEWDDVKSSGYAESESGEGGAFQRGGAQGTAMKISLNK
jgi:sorting nexin-9/18/33